MGPLPFLLFLAASITLVGWLYASPPGSSPDDPYHLASIWCGQGFKDDRCLESPGSGNSGTALVPAAFNAIQCLGSTRSGSAGCLEAAFDIGPDRWAAADTNLNEARAGLYYSSAHYLVTDDLRASMARIRAMNAVVALVLVTLSALVAAPDLRRALLVTWAVSSLPLGYFLLTSLNTTAWGIAGLGTVWANGLTALRPGSRWRRGIATLLALIGGTLALGARTESAAHLAVTALVLAILWRGEMRGPSRQSKKSKSRSIRLALTSIVGVGAVISLVVLLAPTSYFIRILTDFSSGWERLVERGVGNPFLSLAVETPQLWTGALGTWSLGWLDTHMPSMVSVPTTTSFVVLAAAGLRGASRTRITAFATTLASMLLLPVVSLIGVGLVLQEQFQARHYMTLLYVLLGIALVRSPGQRALLIERGTHLTLTLRLSIAHAVALFVNMRRYMTGLVELLYVDLSRDVEWWWGGLAPSPSLVWSVASASFGFLVYGVLGLLRSNLGAGQNHSAPATEPSSVRRSRSVR